MLATIKYYLDLLCANFRSVATTCLLADYAFRRFIDWRQYLFLGRPPSPTTIRLTGSKAATRANDYEQANLVLLAIEATRKLILNLVTVNCNLMPRLWYAWGSWIGTTNDLLVQTMAATSLSIIDAVTYVPIDWCNTFGIEQSFGFNRQTTAKWLAGKLKGWVLGIFFVGSLQSGIIYALSTAGVWSPVFIQVFISVVVLVLQLIYPVLVMPIFNKFKPITDLALSDAILSITKSVGFSLNEVSVMDSSSQSSHNNALFVGLPGSRRIVLYDTLVESQSVSEIVAVIAHELGHWQHMHLLKQLLIGGVLDSIVTVLVPYLIHESVLYEALGFIGDQPVFAAYTAYNLLITPIETLKRLVTMSVSRKHEYEADEYAVNLGHGAELGESLRKMYQSDLDVIDMDPAYAALHRNHPVPVGRLHRIATLTQAASQSAPVVEGAGDASLHYSLTD